MVILDGRTIGNIFGEDIGGIVEFSRAIKEGMAVPKGKKRRGRSGGVLGDLN